MINFINKFSNLDLLLNTWNKPLLYMALSVWLFMRSLASMIWIRCMQSSKTFKLFSFLHCFIYMGYSSFPFQICPLPSKIIFLLAVFETHHDWALSPQLLFPSFVSSVNSAVFGALFKIFWNLCPSFTENIVCIFAFQFFFWMVSGRGENWIYVITVMSEVPMKYYYFYRSKHQNIRLIFTDSQ